MESKFTCLMGMPRLSREYGVEAEVAPGPYRLALGKMRASFSLP